MTNYRCAQARAKDFKEGVTNFFLAPQLIFNFYVWRLGNLGEVLGSLGYQAHKSGRNNMFFRKSAYLQ